MSRRPHELSAEEFRRIIDEWLKTHKPNIVQREYIEGYKRYLSRLDDAVAPTGRFLFETKGQLSDFLFIIDKQLWKTLFG